jgi:hypothetical protein
VSLLQNTSAEFHAGVAVKLTIAEMSHSTQDGLVASFITAAESSLNPIITSTDPSAAAFFSSFLQY